ncbi:ATP-dependent helicase/nuclease subunit A [Loktanella ponticola]|uniref:DNA 3'-5' helicase n=1 Tax=Yoonia ponticola TaxID=1524255 RepID=A0A7W9EX14_9RHOB|nr:double-strand break repair helicase AddA [Yoonia ponticola]MBB5721297.1 ATP-dependent helicase/nuclease subunit A [Yoonia ponticola]
MIRDDATQRQVNAADPLNSTWLSANAGSGKTRVLTDRVARLLLEQVDPQNILCLTYTKAAAAEMQNRLFKRLGAWAMMPDAALRADLTTLGFDKTINSDELKRARTLFAQAIETPGGLKIQTIHSFCAGVLRRFPLEAAVSPQFREMEDRQAEILRAEVMDALLLGPDADTVHTMLRHFTGADVASLTAEVANKRGLFSDGLSVDALHNALDLRSGLTSDILLDTILGVEEREVLKRLQTVLSTGTVTEKKAADALASIDLHNPPKLSHIAVLESLFLFGEKAKSPFGAKIDSFPTKATREAHPELIDDLNIIMETVEQARDDRLALVAFDRSLALNRFGAAFVPAYEARKTAMGMLDFDDLIQKTKALLTDRRVAQWVLFRLDGGIDHVLVDEAQDTSPDQWAVIKQLTQEFTAGEGADPTRRRTIFVVGDKKQSIYSFQGADPAAFDQMRGHFEEGLAAVEDKLHGEALLHSFRSSQAILRVVDETFKRDRAAGLEPNVQHLAFKQNMPGRVDLWPVIEPTDDKPEVDWTDPVDIISTDHHVVRLANQIAFEIKRMVKEETIPEEIGHSGTYNHRPVTEGDILILVQRRSDLFSEIIRACKAANLKIAGADRLRVGAELAVKDLAALLSFLALPEDDLSLASALKSPLFGWSEQDLYALAHHRPNKGHLWPALRQSDDHEPTKAILRDLRKQSDFLRPYDLIERILTRHDGRRKLLARLGAEAEDGIDALLSQALAYESTGVPSLTGFLAWMATDDLEVKRQMDSQGDRIRVMTVHGAKGLEAPIVFLPDTAKRRIDVKQDIFAKDGTAIWKTPAAQSPSTITGLRDTLIEKQSEERMRLLYVAMTRAEKWLIVGAAGDVGDGDESWYNIISDGMIHAGDVVEKVGLHDIRRVPHLDWHSGEKIEKTVTKKVIVTPPIFGETPIGIRRKTLAPSDLKGSKILPGDPGEGDKDAAMARGSMIHLLLEHLPLVDPAQRVEFGHKLLNGQGDDAFDPALVSQVAALLDAPDLAHIFSDDALTEVDVTAHLPELNDRIHGAIDRLLITETTVLAVDYKTNRAVPSSPEQTPVGLLRQMGAYQSALKQIFPDHTIETAILWTQTANLMQLPSNLTEDALRTVT